MISSQRLLLRINLGIIISFIIVKFLLRPYVINNDYPGFVKIFVLSYPNFCEAVVGTILLTFMLLILNNRTKKISEQLVYLIAVLLAAVYVILQEFKIHNLGGVNIYDPYDVLFSVIGLVAIYFIIEKYKPRVI